METDRAQISELLKASAGGDAQAASQLAPLVYEHMRAIAVKMFRAERIDHTLQPTALVHEAYVRLIDQQEAGWQNKNHFVALAARMMRRVLIDHARLKGRDKRGGDLKRTTLSDSVGLVREGELIDSIALERALENLEKRDEQSARIVELRFLGGLTVPETAEQLGVSERQVVKQWAWARAWLLRELGRESLE